MNTPQPNGSPFVQGGQQPNLRQAAPRNAPGGIGARFVANIIDGVICVIVNYPVTMVVTSVMGLSKMAADPTHLGANFWIAEGVVLLCAMVIPALYFGYFYSVKGASLGKMAMGLKVVSADNGTNISFGKAAFRETVGKMVGAMIFGIGYFMALFRGDKRGLHDLMAGTQVISSK